MGGEGCAGTTGDKKGQFTSNLGLRWTFPSQLEGAKEVELGLVRGSAMYRLYVTRVVWMMNDCSDKRYQLYI